MLAAMDESAGHARLVVLVHQLGASRAALRAAVGSAMASGYLEKNPGYGHPLRPEFRLMDSGRVVAAGCREYVRALSMVDMAGCAFRKWTPPLLVALAEGCERYSELESELATVSPRALTQSLKLLGDAGLLKREILDGYPPRTRYALTAEGERLATAATAMAAALAAS